MQLNFVYDTSVNSAPAAFKVALQTAANILDSAIVNPITETIQVGWGENAGSIIPSSAVATGGPLNAVSCSYSQLTAALTVAAKTNGCSYIVSNLSASDPISGSNTYFICQAEAAAIGISDPNAGAIAGTIGFGSNLNWYYNHNSIGASQYDLVGAAIHEITHALGRISGVDIPTYGVIAPLDLYTYTSKGDFQANTGNARGYFSIDGGATNLNNFDPTPNGDAIDWASSVSGDAFGGAYRGKIQALSNTDLLVLQALGYDVPTGTSTLTTVTAVGLTGTAGNDTLIGTHGANNIFHESAGNDSINGGSATGINTVIYTGNQSGYTISGANGSEVVQKPSGGTDTLTNIERLQFADTKIAFDISGNAGTTAKVLGAVCGAASVLNPTHTINVDVGIGLNLLDGGMSYANLMQAALNAVGATTSTAVVNLLWANLFHAAPTTAQAAPYVAMIDSGSYTAGMLGVLAADTSINTTNINLVGLQQTGIHYV